MCICVYIYIYIEREIYRDRESLHHMICYDILDCTIPYCTGLRAFVASVLEREAIMAAMEEEERNKASGNQKAYTVDEQALTTHTSVHRVET